MDNHNNFSHAPWEKDSYETGRTRPPKSRNGLMALLLVAVIFLGGLVSALGLMNIRLFRRMHSPSDIDLAFYAATESALSAETTASVLGREVSAMEQRWYHIPAGFLLTEVSPFCTQQLGLRHGDVLISLDGEKITDSDTLNQQLAAILAGQRAVLEVYRDGQTVTLTLPPMHFG